MRIKNSRLRWLADIVISLLLMGVGMSVCVAICVLPIFSLLRGFPWGLGHGGDCTDLSSYGFVTIIGVVHDTNDSPIQGVEVQASKDKGGCGQSQPFTLSTISDSEGSFTMAGNVHLGDPEVVIEIHADDYSVCQFEYDAAAFQYTVLQLDITLAEIVRVTGHWSIDDDFNQTIESTSWFVQEVDTCS